MNHNINRKPASRNFEVSPESGAFAGELTARRNAAIDTLKGEMAAEAAESAAAGVTSDEAEAAGSATPEEDVARQESESALQDVRAGISGL